MARDLVLYQIDTLLFRDHSGRGWGTLRGIVEKLDHIAGLGVNALWLLPIYESGGRDGGYDVIDHCSIDPRLGTDRDFDELVEQARRRGISVIVELVMQHTSDRHPWFARARADRDSEVRDFYIWRDVPDSDDDKPIFPPVEATTWHWDAVAEQYYRHRFYAHEPDLELANPRVREEMQRIMRHWLGRGVDGFRIDALPYMVERAACAGDTGDGCWLIDLVRDTARSMHPSPILIGEADVDVAHYDNFLQGGSRLTHLLDFHLNNFTFLAIARGDAAPLVATQQEYGAGAPPTRRLAWLRNHDELDLEQLSPSERAEVMARFAPEASMRIYGRGIRRRLAPMLKGDDDLFVMAHALLLSLGQPVVLRYGDEIGMGDEQDLPERNAVRTPMQWHDGRWAGFSDGPMPWRKPVADGTFGYRRRNVAAQGSEPDSILSQLRALLQARRAMPELSTAPVFHRDGGGGLYLAGFGRPLCALAIVNLGAEARTFPLPDGCGAIREIVIGHGTSCPQAGHVCVGGHGYAWIRLEAPGGR